MLKVVCLFAAMLVAPGTIEAAQKLDVPVRGRTITLEVYRPPATPAGTIFMGSGDVGWVGLAASMADTLSARGFIVVGLNVRQYLSSFTDRKAHLETSDVPGDFRAFRDALTQQGLIRHPVVVSGVSEGAAIAVLAATEVKNHDWIDGVITMGLPPTAELAWRWTDASSWITKRDPDEPSFAPATVVASVSPLPLAMIQSIKDEYVTETDYRNLLAAARDPKKQVLIAASNHRFTDKLPELRAAYDDALQWIAAARGGRGGQR